MSWTPGDVSNSQTLSPNDHIHADHINELRVAIDSGSVSGVFNVVDYGATGDGATDDSASVQLAITAANANGGGTVYFPKGSYLCNTALTLLSYVKLEGEAFHTSIIKCTGGNNLFTFSANISHLEFYNLSITATNGHIFYNTSSSGKIGYSIIHHCFFTQNSSTKSIWYQTNGNMISMLFEENYFYTAGTTRSQATWYNIDPHGGCNSNWWVKNTFEMESSSNQPVFYIECTTGVDYTYDNHWEQCVFEVANGGSIQLMSTFGSVIEGCFSYDTTDQLLPMIYLGKGSTGIRSTGTSIRNSGRIGSNIHSGVVDFYFDSHTREVIVDSCRASNDTLKIDCQGCASVTFLNKSAGTVVSNLPGGGFVSGALHDNGAMAVDVMLYGAKGDGVTDDSPAIQAALDAVNTGGGGTVNFPTGVYLVSTVLTTYTKVKIQGQGYTSEILVSGSNDMFTWSGSIAWAEWSNIRLVASGGHIFAPAANAHISQSRLDHCWFSQSSTDKAIWYQATGSIATLTVKNCDHFVGGSSRSLAAWHVIDTAGGNHSNWFENNDLSYGDNCTNQHFIYMENQSTTGYSRYHQFRKNTFHGCDGGSIYLLSHFQPVIDECWSEDNNTIERPVFRINKSGVGSALNAVATTIRNSGRYSGSLDTGIADINISSSSSQTTIQNFRCVPDAGVINLNSNASGVQLINISAGTTITNPGTVQLSTINGDLSLTGIVQLGLYPTASAPTYSKGAMYFDTTLNKLRVGGATAWETVTSV